MLDQGFRELFFPEFQRLFDLLGVASWTEFPGVWHFRVKMLEQFREVDLTSEWDPVIQLGPIDIVDVAADEIGAHAFEPFIVV